MSKSTDRQFREADGAIKRAVATFMSTIDRIERRWDQVSFQLIQEIMLLELCKELTKRIDTRQITDQEACTRCWQRLT